MHWARTDQKLSLEETAKKAGCSIEDIDALEAEIEENQNLQAATGSDYVRLQELQEQLAHLEARLFEKEERWMYLTELKEKIDAQGK